MSSKGDIVIVDDNPDNLTLLATILREAGYRVRAAKSGAQALELISFQLPELIMLDIRMPQMDGFEVCRRLKADEKSRAIPVIFNSALDDTQDKVKGFEAGCVDYVAKPFEPAEVLARVTTQIELYRLRLKLEERNGQLRVANENLELAARTDALTGLANRRAFVEKAEDEIVRFRRTGRIFSIMLSDIDNFKRFNDTHGHSCGDYVLKEVAATLRHNIRQQDSVARWGGEEFIFLLPETEAKGAAIAGEKIRSLLEATIYNYEGQSLRITMTFGVSEFGENLSLDDCISRADEALYQGKAAGRNQVKTWSRYGKF